MKRGKPEKFSNLAEDIRQLIHREQLKHNETLPSERRLAEIFSVNHLTVRKALKMLEQQGVIYKVPSKGNFVGTKPVASRTNSLIGLLLPEKEIFFFEVLTELESRMNVFGFNPIVHFTYGSIEKEEKCLAFFRETGADGVIAVPNKLCEETYRRLNLPTVFFDVYLENTPIPYVIVDDFSGAQSAVEHLISLGHSKIAHIGGSSDETSRKRLAGYETAMKKHNIEIRPAFVKLRDYSRQWGFYAVQELLKSSQQPTAIFCGNDTIAAGALRALKNAGIQTPEKVSVVGFGNTFIAEDLELTTVSQPSAMIADAVWHNMHLQLKGGKPSLENKLGTELIVRKSSTRSPE